jgi:hypothetical protein
MTCAGLSGPASPLVADHRDENRHKWQLLHGSDAVPLDSAPSPITECAAAPTSTIPGAILFHEAQFEGRKVRVPVFLGRRPVEGSDTDRGRRAA